MNIAYVRVSTVEQNEARQVEALEKYMIDKWYVEKISAKDTNRPKLQQMLAFAREGDTIFVHDFTRLARSTKDLLDIVEHLKSKGIHLVSNKESIDTSTQTGKLMLTCLAGIAVLSIMQAAFILFSYLRTPMHDMISGTVTVDFASQMIFDSAEQMLEYKKKLHAEAAERAEYR